MAEILKRINCDSINPPSYQSEERKLMFRIVNVYKVYCIYDGEGKIVIRCDYNKENAQSIRRL